MITEHLISTVPWDDCGAFVRFSVTFVSDKGEAGEAEVIAEVQRRLSAWKFSF
jgi:LL-diaminopimelate aminotransferase